ncbi:hypothetical protein B296_00050530 [Ensete ventricosum]|uniref:Uncharacterized protein n=1 Tax=Ensete ventricosum TaxID=4639 RepID=A0A426YKT4_ENSVE|nr:hypothetical protein B296_00050530 [Ensete ventricosum]
MVHQFQRKSVDFKSCPATDCPRAVLHPGMTRERVDEGRLPKERTNTIGGGGDPVMCWQRPHREKLSYGGMIGSYREHHFGEQHDDKKAMDSRSECHVGELDCSRAYTCLREPDKSEDKDE